MGFEPPPFGSLSLKPSGPPALPMECEGDPTEQALP